MQKLVRVKGAAILPVRALFWIIAHNVTAPSSHIMYALHAAHMTEEK
jgi:hypothetical protein